MATTLMIRPSATYEISKVGSRAEEPVGAALPGAVHPEAAGSARSASVPRIEPAAQGDRAKVVARRRRLDPPRPPQRAAARANQADETAENDQGQQSSSAFVPAYVCLVQAGVKQQLDWHGACDLL